MNEERKNEVNSTELLAKVLSFLIRIKIEPDEDSCMGMAFVTSRIIEDEYYYLINRIEKVLKANAKNQVLTR